MGAHALLAPSSAKRWMTCPPSARLEATMPEKDTAYTREGTIAHAMAEQILLAMLAINDGMVPSLEAVMAVTKNCPGDNSLHKVIDAAEVDGFDAEYMLEVVYDNYCVPVFESYLGAKLEDPEAELLIEARLKLSEFIPEGFGSSDAVLIYGETLEVFDLKFGKGVKVDAEENRQMMCYALGAYCGPGELYDIHEIRMTIIQPRLSHISSWEMSAYDLYEWGKAVLKPAAEKAFKGEGAQTPGDHCRFCKVAAQCKALAAYTLDVAKDTTEPGLMSLEEIAQLLPKFMTVKSWITSVEDYALEAALNGEAVPGYKVVEGRSVRRISNTAQAMEILDKNGITSTQYLKPAELKTITDLEKMLTKKGFKALLGDLVVKPKGKPTLVEEADPRQPLSKASADFNEIIENL